MGATAAVKVMRDGREKTVKGKIGELPEKEAAIGRQFGEGPERDVGFSVGNLTPSVRKQLGLPDNQEGVVVRDVKKTSDAFLKGLREGDVILEVNRVPVSSVGEFNSPIARVEAGDEVLLLVITGGHTRYVTFEME